MDQPPSTSTGGATTTTTAGGFVCQDCDRVFTNVHNRNRHRRHFHNKQKGKEPQPQHPCPKCHRSFSRREHLDKHKGFHINEERRQERINTKRGEKRKKDKRGEKGQEEKKVKRRKIPHHDQTDAAPPPVFVEEEDFPPPEGVDEAIADLYRDNWGAIRDHARPGRNQTTITIRWREGAPPDWNRRLMDIFGSQTRRFKINFSHSFFFVSSGGQEIQIFSRLSQQRQGVRIPSPDSKQRRFSAIHSRPRGTRRFRTSQTTATRFQVDSARYRLDQFLPESPSRFPHRLLRRPHPPIHTVQ